MSIKAYLHGRKRKSCEASELSIDQGYKDLFPEMFKLLDILLTLPVGTASVERSFSQMKLVKTRLRNRITDDNLARLMHIAIEGPELTVVDFDKVLDIFKEKNCRITVQPRLMVTQ